MFLYQQRIFAKLRKSASWILNAKDILQMLLDEVDSTNQLTKTCKIYLSSELFLTELECHNRKFKAKNIRNNMVLYKSPTIHRGSKEFQSKFLWLWLKERNRGIECRRRNTAKDWGKRSSKLKNLKITSRNSLFPLYLSSRKKLSRQRGKSSVKIHFRKDGLDEFYYALIVT